MGAITYIALAQFTAGEAPSWNLQGDTTKSSDFQMQIKDLDDDSIFLTLTVGSGITIIDTLNLNVTFTNSQSSLFTIGNYPAELWDTTNHVLLGLYYFPARPRFSTGV